MNSHLKIFFSVCIVVFVGIDAISQNFTEEDITGKWKVMQVFVTKAPKGKEAEIEKQKSVFQKSVFRFDAGKYFTLTFDIEGDDPEIEKMEIRAAHWKLDSPNLIIIEEWKVKDSDKLDLMEIKLKREGERILFVISDSCFKLEVQKIIENDN